MRSRNPLSRHASRKIGPPPSWPPPEVIAVCRTALVARRGLPPGSPPEAVAALRRAQGWFAGVDMRSAPDRVVVRRLWVWAVEAGVVEAVHEACEAHGGEPQR